MSTHTVAYEILSSGTASAAGLLPHTVSSSHHTGIPVSGTGAYAIPAPLVPPSGYSTVPVAELTAIEFGDTDLITTAWSDSQHVAFQGAYTDNAVPFMRKETAGNTGFNSGRLAPRIDLNYSGASEPANATSIEAHVRWAYSSENYQGLMHFAEFEEHPPDTDDSGATRLAELLQAFQRGGASYQVGVDSGGTAIVVPHCAFAATAPEGAVFVRPEDLGTGPDQIPPQSTSNESSKFRAHPSVFFTPGRSKYVRQISRQAVDTVALDTSSTGGPLGITNVDTGITASDWLIVVDGQPCIVRLTHPAGSDLRRPRDIYEKAWGPILNGPSTSFSATQFVTGAGNIGGVGFRWAYADYFRCLGLPGTNVVQSGPA